MKRLLMIWTVMLFTTMTIMAQKMYITIDGRTETATLVDNSATQKLVTNQRKRCVENEPSTRLPVSHIPR